MSSRQATRFSRTCFRVAMSGLLICAGGCGTGEGSGGESVAETGAPEVVVPARGVSTSIPEHRPAPLAADQLDAFLAWAGRSGHDEREAVRRAIAGAERDVALVDGLFARLAKSDVADLDRSLVILGVLGELRDPRARERLLEIVQRPLPEQSELPHGALGDRDLLEMLQAKAVEVLAYLRSEASNRDVLEVAGAHPSLAVRSAAADAYLYNNGDSAEARAGLLQVLSEEDRLLADRVRRSSTTSSRRFDEGLRHFYELHPEQVAEPPGQPAEAGEGTEPPQRGKAVRRRPIGRSEER